MRIPRENILNRTGDVTPDGRYVTPYKVTSLHPEEYSNTENTSTFVNTGFTLCLVTQKYCGAKFLDRGDCFCFRGNTVRRVAFHRIRTRGLVLRWELCREVVWASSGWDPVT